MRRQCWFLLGLIGWVCASSAAKLESLVVKEQAGKTSIYCSFSGYVTHKAFMLSGPTRAVVDLKQTTTSVNLNHAVPKQGLIKQLRSGHSDAHTLRLVFDIKQSASVSTTPWQPMNKKLHGLRIDLKTGSTSVRSYATKSHPFVPSPHPISVAAHYVPKAHGLRDVIVVIDPGHGGKDPGARGPRQSVEKTVVLAIARKLKEQIDRQPGMRAVLTRNGDYYIGLRERLTIARRYNADVFVAIHADAFINHQSHGASVFALSQRGATSEAARWLAAKENYSELGGVNLSGLDDQSGLIRKVLIDLSQTATISSSLQMGTEVLRNMGRMTSLHNVNVEQARFMVLKSPDIPSILVETGFISNPNEERNLTNPAYQARLTQALCLGIKQYFWTYPPRGTRLEAMVTNPRHRMFNRWT